MSAEFVLDNCPLPVRHPPEGWVATSIGQLASSIAPGFPCGAHNAEQRGTPHIRPMNIDREGRFDLGHVKFVEGEVPATLRKGDVLFNNTNSPELIGKTTVVPVGGEFGYSNHMTRIRLADGLAPSFIAQQLHFLWMSGYFRHRCVNHVNQASISAAPLATTVPLLVPPAREQQRIADAIDELFSDLDAGVAALHRVRAKLKLYRASVLKAAVEGALTAEWREQHPEVESGAQLLQRILVERRRRWEEHQLAKHKAKGAAPPKNWKVKYRDPEAPDLSGLSALPMHWAWTCMGQCFSVHVGATPSRGVASYWNGDIPWVASGEVRFAPIHDTRECISQEGLANASTKLNPVGSVMLSMIGEGKTRGQAGILKIAAANNQNCAAIWASQTPVSPTFVYLWLLYRYEQTRELGSGNNQPEMNKTIVEAIPLPLPPLLEQEAIVELVEVQLSVIDHLEADLDAKLASAQALRQSILRHAFAGKLVPQDPNDEPAPELLKRIAAERPGHASRRSNAPHRSPKAPPPRIGRLRRRADAA